MPKSIASSGNFAAMLVGAAVCGLLVWVFKAGDPGSMQVIGVALANPETQREKVPVEGIGVHGVIGNGAHTHGAMTAAQSKADQEQHTQVEAGIFLKPGGLYTQADIDRNGPLPPSKRFADIMARHDLKVHPGERICPITETKANERFFWWVGGRRYTFCCPPCVEEFVLKAKKGGDEARKAPEEYVKR